MRSFLFTFVSMMALLMLASSCEPDNSQSNNDMVEVTALIDGAKPGDAFSVVGWYDDIEPWNAVPLEWWNDAICTFNGERWMSEPSMFWKNDATNHFLAWYPADFAQSKGGLEAVPVGSNDVLLAKSSMYYNGGDNRIALVFSHLLAKLEVRLLFKGKYKTASDIVVSATDICTSATVNMLDTDTFFNLADDPDTSDDNTLLLKQKAGNDTVLCHYQTSDIVIPQQISKFEISFKYGNNDNLQSAQLEYEHDGLLKLSSNALHTLTLEVRNGKVNFTNFTVSEWNNEESCDCDTERGADDTPYLTFTADQEQTLSFKLNGSYVLDEGLQYSVNEGEWMNWDPSASVSFGAGRGSLRLRGESLGGTASSISKYAQIVFGNPTVPVACSGDLRTLVDYVNYYEADTENAQFCYLFRGCTNLTSAPELPAQKLAERCYFGLFYGCTGLTEAPALPATTLNGSCYYSMFYGCTALESAPLLPAAAMAPMCYYNMFYGCSSLEIAPELPALTLAESCYSYMFYGCSGLTAAPSLPASVLEKSCYAYMYQNCTGLTSAHEIKAASLAQKCCYYMFRNCTSLTQAPALSATTLAKSCYEYMFYGCTGLISAPELPAPDLADRCYFGMFYGCTNLSSITMLATDISASSCLSNWVKNVSAAGTFTKAAAMTSLPSGVSGIPVGWSVKDF